MNGKHVDSDKGCVALNLGLLMFTVILLLFGTTLFY